MITKIHHDCGCVMTQQQGTGLFRPTTICVAHQLSSSTAPMLSVPQAPRDPMADWRNGENMAVQNQRNPPIHDPAAFAARGAGTEHTAAPYDKGEWAAQVAREAGFSTLPPIEWPNIKDFTGTEPVTQCVTSERDAEWQAALRQAIREACVGTSAGFNHFDVPENPSVVYLTEILRKFFDYGRRDERGLIVASIAKRGASK